MINITIRYHISQLNGLVDIEIGTTPNYTVKKFLMSM